MVIALVAVSIRLVNDVQRSAVVTRAKLHTVVHSVVCPDTLGDQLLFMLAACVFGPRSVVLEHLPVRVLSGTLVRA